MSKKPLTPAQEATILEIDRLNKLFFARLGDREGQEIVNRLKKRFDVRSPLKRDKEGRIDVYQTIANCGAYEVLSEIDQCIDMGSPDKQRTKK